MPAAAPKPAAERMTQEARRALSDRRLVAAGIRLIATHGTGGTSLAQIGEAAGYSRGLPAERFGSKLRFLEAVVLQIEKWFDRRLAERLQGRRGMAEIAARIAQHLDGAVGGTEATRALHHLYADAGGGIPGLRPRMAALGQTFQAGFAAAIVDAQTMAEADPALDPERHAAMIFAAVRGVAVQFLTDGNEHRLRTTELDLIALFERALRKETP
jgi:AcrR family transcriptional regulator